MFVLCLVGHVLHCMTQAILDCPRHITWRLYKSILFSKTKSQKTVRDINKDL